MSLPNSFTPVRSHVVQPHPICCHTLSDMESAEAQENLGYDDFEKGQHSKEIKTTEAENCPQNYIEPNQEKMVRFIISKMFAHVKI